MKVFQEPVMELVEFDIMDVITTSEEIDTGNLGGNGTTIG